MQCRRARPIRSRHAAPAPRTNHPQPGPHLLAAEHGHLESRVGQYLEGGTIGPVEVLVERVLIAPPREHLASVRATIGG